MLVINCGGHWKENIYKGGFSKTTFVYRNLVYEYLLSMVHAIVCVDHNNFVYEIKSLLNTIGKIARFKIKNDRDV